MSTYKIREKFSYLLATSSIDYIRNYNFNNATVSDITLAMANSDEQIPITVNITTTEPWIQIVDSLTGANKKYPNGNVVLNPTSSVTVLVKIDLPPEIESITESTIYPNISLDIKSGSFPILVPENNSSSLKNTIVASQNVYTINPGERVQVDITVYDENGVPEVNTSVIWKSNNMSVVQVEEPENTEIDYNPYTPRTIRGISPGETTVTVIAPDRETNITFIVRETSSSTSTQQPSGVDVIPTSTVVE